MAAKNSEVEPADPAHAARKKNLDLALQQIAKDYGEGAIMRLGDDKIVAVEVIPTGNILIDRALGVGGFLSMSNTRLILNMLDVWALTLMISWSRSRVRERKRSESAKR